MADLRHNPIRVLYVARGPFISGAERALVSQLRFLDRDRVQPRLVLGHKTELVRIAGELDIPVDVAPLPKRSPRTLLSWWRCLGKLRTIIADFEPALLHANDVPSCQAVSVLGRKLGIGRVVHVRWDITAEALAWWARGGCDVLLCISDWMRQRVGDVSGTAVADAEAVVLPDAVDWPATDDVARQRQMSERPTLGFAGQLIESKGLDLVIDALGRLDAGQRPRLRVAGEDTQHGGAYKQQLQQRAEQAGVAEDIEWLGFLDDVTSLHREVWAMVCPSRIEPLGLVPLEAARFGAPTMANRVGGLAETIIDGETGWHVEPTVEAWAAALPRVLDRHRNTGLGEAARVRTMKRHGPAAYQQALMGIYERIGSERRGR